MTTTTHLAIRLAILLIAAASLPALSQLHLAPIFGALLASADHYTLTSITVLASFLYGPYSSSSRVLAVANSLAILRSPPQDAVLYLTRHAGIALGPLLLSATVFMPTLFLLVDKAHAALVELCQYRARAHPDSDNFLLLVPWLLLPAFLLVQACASSIIPLLSATGYVLLSRRVLRLVLCDWPLAYSSTKRPRWRVLYMSLAGFGMMWEQTRSSKRLGDEWKVLARGESVTGYISVLENTELQYRLLRCDHSLLGGEWLLTEQRRREEGWQVPEPVFGVFAMLEAVRLVQGPDSQSVAHKKDSERSALVIGLGAGTAPTALLSHSITTTILELDPLVHTYASTFFALPPNHTFHPVDAVSWVHHAASSPAPTITTYDYIIHDVFTGGAAPLALYATSFLRALRRLLNPKGVAAINFTGDLARAESPMHAVLRTIVHVFEGRCRAFRDTPPAQGKSGNQEKDEDMLNVVIFCVSSAEAWPFGFREAVESDYLGSKTRREFLVPRGEREVVLPVYRGVDGGAEGKGEEERGDWEGSGMLRTVTEANVGRWRGEQLRAARAHWRGMREVVPAGVWEGW